MIKQHLTPILMDIDIYPKMETTVNDYLNSFEEHIGQIEFVDNLGGRIYTDTEIPFIDEDILNRQLDCVRIRKCDYGYFVHMKLKDKEK